MPQTILPVFSANVIPINNLLSFAKRDGMIYYFHGCFPVFCHHEDGLKSFRMFSSQLYVNGSRKQSEIVRAFGVSAISVKRWVKKYRTGGTAAFFVDRKKRRPRVLTPEVVSRAQEMLNEGLGRSEVAKELALKPDTLYKAIRSGRLVEGKKREEGKSTSKRSVEDSQAAMGMGCTRVVERVCAATGTLLEASTRFDAALDVPNGGLLWSLSTLLENGLLRHSREFFGLPKDFYSLVQIFVSLGVHGPCPD